ncbi:peptidase T [Jonquetella anthropi]|uniref:peptidase T n=1 Tax=Jonquetella anthropi TaxID=428712 RepID=UPI0001B91487|nr:peptidase T [Jonquetella anthropi]EEX47900.1 peptidase T [Jonquetella anthropi E3_33 E1]
MNDSKLVQRFIRYITTPTQSDDTSKTVPSTPTQHVLAKMLGQELRDLGLSDVKVTEHAYVTAKLPGNNPTAPCIGLIAHIDTALEVTDDTVNPRIVENYDGTPIVLDKGGTTVLSPDAFPSLKDHIGSDLIVTDGTTLLGADDKAGIAEIMTAVEYLKDHPEISRGDVAVCFCPDEEIGHGASLLDLKDFGAQFAYTVDGTGSDTFNWETFNAARADYHIQGLAVHPGSSKNKMVNANLLAAELIGAFPPAETPSHTEDREGFYHLCEMTGGVEEAELHYIIRDHDRQKFESRKAFAELVARQMNERFGREVVTVSVSDQYANMADVLREKPEIVDTALQAMKDCGITPQVIPVRGGTDGSQLSLRGLPTPNLFTGGYNAHGKYEYAVIQSMEGAVKVLCRIVELFGKR